MTTTIMASGANSQVHYLSSSKSTTTRRHPQLPQYHCDQEKPTSLINPSNNDDDIATHHNNLNKVNSPPPGRKLSMVAVLRLRSALTAFRHRRGPPQGRLGHRVVGTLFGYRRGHVNFVLQREHNTSPVLFIELATPITRLVKEMASGLVRIALECDKQEELKVARGEGEGGGGEAKLGVKGAVKLMDEPVWRTFCNGKQCGYATKKEPGPKELKILKAVEPISMGAGVLPGFNGAGAGPEGELMYMRAKFERVVGSRDSEAFYMMNPDCNGAPELSIYLLRV
ncbi:hypothetical protein Ancab_038732 [Ancistrocladus abbreviatus]